MDINTTLSVNRRKIVAYAAVTITLLTLPSFASAHMPLTGERMGDYLVDTVPKAAVVGEEARIIIHLGNIKTGGPVPTDLDITVEFLESGDVVESCKAEPGGPEPGDYTTPIGHVYTEPGRYKIRVRMLGEEADFEIKVVEQFEMSGLMIWSAVGVVIVMVIAIVAVVRFLRR